jgi:hypothetical protein
VAPPGVAVVRDGRAAGAQRARDAVGAAAGHDGVVVALDDQCRRAQPERCGVISRQDPQQRADVGAGREYPGDCQRRRALGQEVIDPGSERPSRTPSSARPRWTRGMSGWRYPTTRRSSAGTCTP